MRGCAAGHEIGGNATRCEMVYVWHGPVAARIITLLHCCLVDTAGTK